MKKVKFKIVMFLLVTGICGLYAEEKVFSEGDFEYTVESGKASIEGYTGDDEILIIPEKLGGHEVKSIGNMAFAYSGLTTLEIPDSVTSIGDKAFYGCESLESIVIPDSVTSIGRGAFYGCESLKSIRLSKNNSVYSFIEGVLFDKKQKILHTYLMSNKGTSYVIPDSVTSIGERAFAYSGLTTLAIPDSVTNIGERAFSGCSSLASIVIPNSVTSIGDGAFYWCSSLTTLEIPDSVISIGEMAFVGCSSLTMMRVSKDHSVYNFIEGVLFDKEQKLLHTYLVSNTRTSYVIPDSIISIGEGAFFDSESLTTLEIPDSVTSIGEGAFAICTSLTTLEIPDSVTSIGESAFAYCYSLATITIPDSVTNIGEEAFAYCYSLATIKIPDSVTSIGEGAFYGCDNLTLTIENDGSYAHKYALENDIDFVLE